MHTTQTPAASTAAPACTPPTANGSASAVVAPASTCGGECSPCHQLLTLACGLWRMHHKNPVIGWRYLSSDLALAYSEF